MALIDTIDPDTLPEVQLTGMDGNAFNIMGRVVEALRRGGFHGLVEEYRNEATSGDYDHLLATTLRYVRAL